MSADCWILKRRSRRSSPNSLLLMLAGAKSRCACCWRTTRACPLTRNFFCAPPLAAAPGTCAAYSDIGFMILGVALERLADEALDLFCQREIFGPLCMTHTTFKPAHSLKDSAVPTADD